MNDGFVKRPYTALRCILSHCGVPISTPHSCGFARLAYGPFYKTVRKKDGFTLLEIMVALAIIGSLLVTVLYSLNYHLGIAEKHEFITVATMLAKNKMSDMEQTPATGTGTFPDPYSAYNYETGIKASSYPGLSEMWVTVSRDKENVKLTELRQNTQNPGNGQ